jgi:hypothetical protein
MVRTMPIISNGLVRIIVTMQVYRLDTSTLQIVLVCLHVEARPKEGAYAVIKHSGSRERWNRIPCP